MSEVGGLGLPPPAANRDADRAGSFGGEVKAPGCRHRQPRHFGDDGAKTAMTQAFLETGQQRLVVTGFDIDDAAGKQAGLRQGRGEQILSRHAPQHLALGASRDSGGEQCCRRAVDRTVAATRHLMERAKR